METQNVFTYRMKGDKTRRHETTMKIHSHYKSISFDVRANAYTSFYKLKVEAGLHFIHGRDNLVSSDEIAPFIC